MFSDQPTIVSAGQGAPANMPAGVPDYSPESPVKKILLAVGGLIVLGGIIFGIFMVVKRSMAPKDVPVEPAPVATSSTLIPTLPDLGTPEAASSTDIFSASSSLAIEYLSFADFYQVPDNNLSVRLNDYSLPLNIKMDVINYYDVSRKLGLDPILDKLNNQGFGLIDNPWPQEAADFYSVYSHLDDKQLPLMITSDFMIYYYQNLLKKTFKDIEESVFYDNLWEINKAMYTAAKERYETRLAAIGNINDSILEGERLEMAFFAVALELLKPAPNQLPGAQSSSNTGVFSVADVDQFYFVTPPYLKDDVAAEVKLIREGRAQTKSPVMLYNRNYQDFSVPSDYKSNAKLNNFYLTTTWLNSVFPLDYRSQECPNCLLDMSDWRIHMIAASFMSKDFSDLPDLKNKWARIYKVISFFKGLREDLNYVHYRDSLSSLFGNDYVIEDIFADSNREAPANLEKLRNQLAGYDFAEISGALSRNDQNLRPFLGFKLLAESYWPDNYIFSRLTAPAIGSLNATTTGSSNITFCRTNNQYNRCGGIALDIVNLAHPISGNAYFSENTGYAGYLQAADKLRSELVRDNIWHYNNYWTNLNLMKSLLATDSVNLPLYARSDAWRDKSLATAAGAWINLQLPPDDFSAAPAIKGAGFESAVHLNENSYVEPNFNLVNELMADTAMMTQMLSALQLDADARFALQDIRNFSSSLASMRSIIMKELTGEALDTADNEAIADFAKQFPTKAAPANDKKISIRFPLQKNDLKEDLSRLKLLVIVHQEGDSKVLSVGPVWDYRESR